MHARQQKKNLTQELEICSEYQPIVGQRASQSRFENLWLWMVSHSEPNFRPVNANNYVRANSLQLPHSEAMHVRICFQNKKGNVGRDNVGWYKCVHTRNVAGRWTLNIRETLTCLVSPKITSERLYWRGGFKVHSGKRDRYNYGGTIVSKIPTRYLYLHFYTSGYKNYTYI